ncbi:MAG: sigma-54 interaction domain-containing protein [Planctomycetota bacterium]
MARPLVLIVGEGGRATNRLGAHLSRRGLQPRPVRDCGEALVTLHHLGERPGGNGIRAVVLDVATAGVGVAAFREMLQAEQPGVAVLELPPEHAGPEDVGLLVAALEDEIRRAGRRGDASSTDDAEPVAPDDDQDDDHEGPVHGVKFEDLESLSPRMHALFELLPRVARSESPVLIVGETGTGKELVAAAIHRQSKRRDREFFTVNCGALTETLLESELFGHERGAFTGAVKTKKGYFELASGGTLFLDELGTISQAMQVKLLRVLETMEVRRVGGSGTLSVDVRVVAATNEDLDAAVSRGEFREDLYYRLNVVQVRLPALRERPEDIPLLAEVFRERFASTMGRRDVEGFSPAALRRLQTHRWPGNVRELQNVVQRATLFASGTRIEDSDLPERLRRAEGTSGPLPSFDVDAPLQEVLDGLRERVEREYLKRLLRRYKGLVGRVATHAGLNRRTLYNKMRAHGLDRREFR